MARTDEVGGLRRRAGLVLLLTLAARANTRFPEDPEDHRPRAECSPTGTLMHDHERARASHIFHLQDEMIDAARKV